MKITGDKAKVWLKTDDLPLDVFCFGCACRTATANAGLCLVDKFGQFHGYDKLDNTDLLWSTYELFYDATR